MISKGRQLRSHGYEKVTVARLLVKWATADGIGMHLDRTA